MTDTIYHEPETRELTPQETPTAPKTGTSDFIYRPTTDYSHCSVFIYCPHEDVEALSKILKRHPDLNACINCYDLRDFKNKILCHFKSAYLSHEQQQFLIGATELGAWVEPLVSYFDRTIGYTETELLHSGYFLHQKAFSILSERKNGLQKRAIDLLFATAIGLLALPIGVITALLIKLESPGPIFFKQKRTGQYNKEFNVIKFRSMRNDAEKNGAQWATKNDARVTKVGKFIRKTRIDELPQLINVFKGEMSLVGPRPEREVFIAELEKSIPYYRFRHAVKPGVTGVAQVKYPYGASVEDAIWKHKYDVYYIKHQTWKMELKILALTVKTVLFGMGR
ncbi:sugar transferase [Salinivibrio sp. IB872]|uniref:sugar transferase n=1 Tax=Salinivibrio sp. IB872 TaxID=1766123 RepID=UPI00098777BA|nr:exopolysaccharide biosynthesis protein [Salinivibrio sp. IB872]